MKLNELYNLKLLEYKVTGNVDDINKLLAIRLFNERENFEPLICDDKRFYETYKKEIDKNIEKIMSDFEITDEKLTEYIKNRYSVEIKDYENNKILYAFFGGICTLHNAILCHSDKTNEQLFFEIYKEDLSKYPMKSIFNDEQLTTPEVLHNVNNEKQMKHFKNIECHPNHGPFLFLNNLSFNYEDAAENKVIYRCACLVCGKMADYDMHIADRIKTVYTNKESGIEALQDYYIIRKKLMEMNLVGIKIEDAVASINKLYNDSNKKTKIMKKNN